MHKFRDQLSILYVHSYTLSKFKDEAVSVADPGGVGGLNPPLQRLFFVFFACQYMKIPMDVDPKPPLRRILAQNPPFKEFLDPPLSLVLCRLYILWEIKEC